MQSAMNGMLIKLSLILICLLAAVNGFSQNMRIYGKVLNAASGDPVEFAIVSVLSGSDSLIDGALTKANGDFLIEKVSRKARKIRIQFIGFDNYTSAFQPVPSLLNYDLGNIQLKVNEQLLKEVTITAEKAQVTLGIDRRIYQVDKDLSALGGTALDAMKNIPGLTIDSDNSVKLRNQSPTIFIDGRPTLLSLDQVPANEIERIEVITNPSAKYVADATGGILNVILKKNLSAGYFGMLNAGLGTNNRYSINGNVSLREKKITVQLSGNYSHALNLNNGITHREDFSNGIISGRSDLKNTNRTNRFGGNGRASIDYRINVRSIISAAYSYNENLMQANEKQEYITLDSLQQVTQDGYRLALLNNNWKVHNAQLTYRYNYPKAGKEISADINLTSSKNLNLATFDTYSGISEFPLFTQNNNGERNADLLVCQLDYVNPLTENSRLEWGARSSYKKSYSDFEIQITDPLSGATTVDSALSNQFKVDDFIGAAYVNYAGRLGKFSYQAGLRFEKTTFIATSVTTGEEFSFIYPQKLNDLHKTLFPAIYFSRKIKEAHEFQLNFSRKIGRPGYMQLIPFVMFADRQSVQIGNPVLAPEFINIAEFNYSFTGEKASLLTGIYSRQTINPITTIIYPSEVDPLILINTYGNGTSKLDYGWESTFKRTLGKFMDFNVNGNIFFSEITVDQSVGSFSNKGVSWNIKGMLKINAAKKLSFQLSGNYEAPRIIAQGKTNPVWFTDASANINVNKKLSVSATISDVFNSKRFGTLYMTDRLTQETIRRWETRYFRINVTWKFGEPDVSIFRRRNNSRREPGSGGTEMEF